MPRLALALLAAASTPAMLYAQSAEEDPALRPGFEIGAQGGYYRYTENPKFMELESTPAYGVFASQQGLGDSLPNLRLEGRFLNAKADYASNNGTTSDETNWLAEGRVLYTANFFAGDLGLAPYVGYGYRFLRNEGKNTASSSGYTRESQYHYAPVGAWLSLPVGDASLVAQAEYGRLLHGEQYSAISTGLKNTQSNGSEYRFFMGYRGGSLQFGPYAQFWRVEDSSTNCVPGYCGLEPKNFTREVGLSLSYHFGG